MPALGTSKAPLAMRLCNVCSEPGEAVEHRRYASGWRCVRCKRHHARLWAHRRYWRRKLARATRA